VLDNIIHICVEMWKYNLKKSNIYLIIIFIIFKSFAYLNMYIIIATSGEFCYYYFTNVKTKVS
jgi:hypothetical protein